MSRVGDTLDSLAACLLADLQDRDAVPCFADVVPGETAIFEYIDGCDDATSCGMAWVRLGTFYPSTAVGVVNEEPGSCDVSWSYDIEMGVVRCFPIEESEPPDTTLLAELVAMQVDDMMSLVRAVKCCFGQTRSKDYLITQYVPIGPDGNVIGGQFTVIVSDP